VTCTPSRAIGCPHSTPWYQGESGRLICAYNDTVDVGGAGVLSADHVWLCINWTHLVVDDVRYAEHAWCSFIATCGSLDPAVPNA
jgi:hypothetical protein